VPLPAELEESLRRSGVVWVGLDGAAPRLVWHLWHDGAVNVVCGGAEQPLPGAETARRAVVAVRARGPLTGRAADLTADVEQLRPGTPEWDVVAPLLAAQRLNAADPGGLTERWAAGSVVLRLRPAVPEQ
jgi:hypothetical protein